MSCGRRKIISSIFVLASERNNEIKKGMPRTKTFSTSTYLFSTFPYFIQNPATSPVTLKKSHFFACATGMRFFTPRYMLMSVQPSNRRISMIPIQARSSCFAMLFSPVRFLSHCANAVKQRKTRERWVRNQGGIRFHACGAVHELEVGKLKGGAWACQFVFCTTTWEGVEENEGTSEKLGPKVFSVETLSSNLAKCHSSSLEKPKGRLSKKMPSGAVPFSSTSDNLSSPLSTTTCTSSILLERQKWYGLQSWASCTAKEQIVVRCTGTEAFARAFQTCLSNSTVVEVDGEVVLHREALSAKNASVKDHTEIRITQDRLQAAADILRVLYCGPHQSVEVVQERIQEASFLD